MQGCGTTFAATRGTLFYRKHAPLKDILETLALVAEGVRISSLSRAKGFKEDTILRWLREAARHAEAVEDVLLADYELSKAQVDGLCTCVDLGEQRSKGGYPESADSAEFWRCTLIESETRLRAARGLAKNETEAAIEAFEQLKGRGQRHSLQMVKRREKGRVMGVRAKTIYADEREVLELLGQSTSYVERTNLTSRHMNGRLVRKTLGYSKELEMLRASSIWEDALYNLGRALKTLRIESPKEASNRRRWIGRSPAMAAGLTDHIWEVEELLSVLPLPSTNT
jgi:hypothetical protein